MLYKRVSFPDMRLYMFAVILPGMLMLLAFMGCAAPSYLSVPPADLVDQNRRLPPGSPEQAVIRDQHLGQLQVEVHYLEDALLRAEQQRLSVCRIPEATQVDSVAYQRCQVKDQRYEQLKTDVRVARARYLGAISGSGGLGR